MLEQDSGEWLGDMVGTQGLVQASRVALVETAMAVVGRQRPGSVLHVLTVGPGRISESTAVGGWECTVRSEHGGVTRVCGQQGRLRATSGFLRELRGRGGPGAPTYSCLWYVLQQSLCCASLAARDTSTGDGTSGHAATDREPWQHRREVGGLLRRLFMS
jgi:hypothetical protein